MHVHTTLPTLLTPYGTERDVQIMTADYVQGGLAVQLFTQGEAYTTLSVWLPESADLPEGWFYAKTWSENEGLVEALIGAGVLECDPLHIVRTGFVHAIACHLL